MAEKERIETREPVTLKVSRDGGEERTFPPGMTFTVTRFMDGIIDGKDPVFTARDGTQVWESEDAIRHKIARAEKRAARAEKRVDTWRAVVTGVTIGVVLKLVDLAGWLWGLVFG